MALSDDVVRVRYQVDVWVHVDPENNEIVSVHVDDWSLRGPLEVARWDDRPVEDVVRQRAVELVRDDADWPIWVIGFEHN
jgi:hypothetical protein